MEMLRLQAGNGPGFGQSGVLYCACKDSFGLWGEINLSPEFTAPDYKSMEPYLQTAIQWLHDTIRVQVRARQGTDPSTASEDWVNLAWEVGHSLSMMQAHGIPAQPVIEAVSEKLVGEFGSDGDFTSYGIRTMRQFYLDYFERPHLQPLLRSVSWDHHKIILALCRDPAQQEFYLKAALDEGLSSEDMAAAIHASRYEVGSAPAKAAPKTHGKTPGKGKGRSSAKVSRKA
jgi:hypothetical protein